MLDTMSRFHAAISHAPEGDRALSTNAQQLSLSQMLEDTKDPWMITQAAASVLGLASTPTLQALEPYVMFAEKIPISFARLHSMVGVIREDGTTVIAMSNIADLPRLDGIQRLLGCWGTTVLFAPKDQIDAAINRTYQQRHSNTQHVIDDLKSDRQGDEINPGIRREDLLDIARRSPVIKLVNLVLLDAAKQSASDIHVQPYEDELIIRLRIDGILFDSYKLPKTVQDEFISRIKVMAKMNIAEKRLPQDGRTTVQLGDATIDLRLSCVPTSYGERIVIRLLNKNIHRYNLHEIGMPTNTASRFTELIRQEHGIILVTGPTGSGKTTTLYGALQQLNSKEKNIITIEDPIEYQLDGISQIQISDKKGMTFASGLRSVLRQDPDIIMIGEIRDRETAMMAIQAALTGHLVFSTLHTNDAATAVTRLQDLGVEPFLVASSVIGVLAQRLVRRVCLGCGQPETLSDIELSQLRVASMPAERKMRRGTGCALCRHTGYRGRVGIFELLTLDNNIRQLIQTQTTAADIHNQAAQCGMTTLREDGICKLFEGMTTLDEILRVTV